MSKAPRFPRSIEPYMERFVRNLSRADNLVFMYEEMYGSGGGRRSVSSQDLLRAAVVFAHATLEDLLRTIAKTYYPGAEEKVLDDIPLSGATQPVRATRFGLGRLSVFRGQTIDAVIEKSVHDYLDNYSYSAVEDIVRVLAVIGIDVERVRSLFPDLAALIERRHQIVHQSDMRKGPGKQGRHYANSINPKLVRKWIEAVKELAEEVTYLIYLREEVPPEKHAGLLAEIHE